MNDREEKKTIVEDIVNQIRKYLTTHPEIICNKCSHCRNLKTHPCVEFVRRWCLIRDTILGSRERHQGQNKSVLPLFYGTMG